MKDIEGLKSMKKKMGKKKTGIRKILEKNNTEE